MPKYSIIQNYSILHPRRSNKIPFLSMLSDLHSNCSTTISFVFNSPLESRGLTRDFRLLEKKKKRKNKGTNSNITTRQNSLISKISRQRKGDNYQQEQLNTNTSKNHEKYNKPTHQLEFNGSEEQDICSFKAFKEDEFPIASIKDIPSINWMKMDNDVTTDEEQLDYGRTTLLDHLKSAIDKEQSEIRYFQKHLSRRLNFAPMTQQSSKMY